MFFYICAFRQILSLLIRFPAKSPVLCVVFPNFFSAFHLSPFLPLLLPRWGEKNSLFWAPHESEIFMCWELHPAVNNRNFPENDSSQLGVLFFYLNVLSGGWHSRADMVVLPERRLLLFFRRVILDTASWPRECLCLGDLQGWRPYHSFFWYFFHCSYPYGTENMTMQ